MNFVQKIKNDYLLKKIADNFDYEIYLVGGAVRDFILNKDTYDRDLIVINTDARKFTIELAELFEATFVPLDEQNKIYRVVLKDKVNYIDVTNPIENSLLADLKRRDITINSIAVNIKTFEVVDVCNAINDLNNKIIKVISEKNITDDPLRLLRIFRFASVYGFSVEEQTLNMVNKHADLIFNSAPERVNYELVKIFWGCNSDEILMIMDKVGILNKLFPFVDELKKIPPNSHHHLRLFEHCIETVKQVQLLYETSDNKIKTHLNNLDFGNLPRIAYLKFAAFMHDIGKFSTWTIENGRHRFIKHDDVGAKLAVTFLKKMHFSNKQIQYITSLIKYHIYPASLMSDENVTEKAMTRFIRKLENYSIDVIILAKADRLSALGPDIIPQTVENNISGLNRLTDFYFNVIDTLEPLPKLLDGNEVMQILNLKPSPKLGEVMEKLFEAQLSGDVITKSDAIEFINKL